MPWIRLDDQFADHPKIVAVGPLAGWLYVCGLCYSGRYLTDGFIPASQVKRLADIDDSRVPALVALLVQERLWEEAEGGYRVHDYLKYNPSRREAEATRIVRAEAGTRGGIQSGVTRRAQGEAKSKQSASGLVDVCLKQNRSKSEPRTHPVPVPVPVPHPVPAREDSEVGAHTMAVAGRKDGTHAGVRSWDAFVALCEETGMEPTAVPKTAKNTALRYCKEMLEATYSVDQIVRCYRYLSKEHWRNSPIDAYAITKGIASWHARGELTDPPAEGRKGQAANNQQGEQERDHGQYAKYVKTFGSQD